MENPGTTSGNEDKSEELQNPKPIKVQYPYKESRHVIVKPTLEKPVLPEKGTLHNSAEGYVQRIGSAWAGPNSSLQLGRTIFSDEEEKEIMSNITGIAPKSEHWEKSLNEFWINLSVPVDIEGLKLEIGFIHYSPTEKKPINYYQYALYRYCMQYQAVAKAKSDIKKSKKIRFYLENPEEIRAQKAELQGIRDAATVLRLEIQKDRNLVNAFADILDFDIIEGDDDTDRIIQLANYANSNPGKFIEMAKDENLKGKAQVKRMLKFGFLTQPLGSTIIIYEGESIGSNLTEAFAWLKDPKNTVAKEVLMAKLKAVK